MGGCGRCCFGAFMIVRLTPNFLTFSVQKEEVELKDDGKLWEVPRCSGTSLDVRFSLHHGDAAVSGVSILDCRGDDGPRSAAIVYNWDEDTCANQRTFFVHKFVVISGVCQRRVHRVLPPRRWRMQRRHRLQLGRRQVSYYNERFFVSNTNNRFVVRSSLSH